MSGFLLCLHLFGGWYFSNQLDGGTSQLGVSAEQGYEVEVIDAVQEIDSLSPQRQESVVEKSGPTEMYWESRDGRIVKVGSLDGGSADQEFTLVRGGIQA